jgi:hypothetical protein
MAKLHITEYAAQGRETSVHGAIMPVAQMPPLAEQTVEIAGASAQSAAFNAATQYICLVAKADCHISIGANPTATNSLKPLTAGQDHYFGVTPGHKVAVILP